MTTQDRLEVIEATRDHAIGQWRGVALYVWRGATTVRAAGLLERVFDRVRELVPDGPGVVLGVVEAGAPPPPAEARTALAHTLGRGHGYVVASALIFEGDGFSASMVRAVATGLAMLARPGYPHQVFAEVGAGTAWLERELKRAGKPRYSAGELASVLHELRTAPHTSR